MRSSSSTTSSSYVEDQLIKPAATKNVQSNILSFQMAMLQRRFASSMYAVQRSLERMRERGLADAQLRDAIRIGAYA